jgi:hypothetical protein
METAPPNTEEEPKDPETPDVDDTALQFANLLELKTIREFWTTVISSNAIARMANWAGMLGPKRASVRLHA